MQKIKLPILFLVLLLVVLTAKAQVILNNSFEEPDTSNMIKNWMWSKAPGFQFVQDSTEPFSGKYAALLSNQSDKSEHPAAAFVQLFKAPKTGMKNWRLSVMIRTENNAPTGLILNAFCGKFPILSTNTLENINNVGNKWRRVVTDFALPTYTNGMSFGGKLTGQGKVWFDDFKLEEIPLKIKPISPIVKNYFTEFIDSLRHNSIRRDSVDFDLLAKDMELIANGATELKDVKRSFQYAFAALNDPLGNYYDSTQVAKDEIYYAEQEKINKMRKPAPINYPIGGVWKDNYALIRIKNFTLSDSSQNKLYADSLIRLIKSFDKQKLKGWMIDLREVNFINRDAVMDGLSPFFNKKNPLTLQYANGNFKTWDYSDTTYYKVKNKVPIAVLTGSTTRGLPEQIVVALKGLKNARQIGEPTGGYGEEGYVYSLSDCAKVVFSIGLLVDANGKKYLGKLMPDQLIPYPKNEVINIKEDALVYMATVWFNSFKYK